jgi:hypothetical protein
MFPSPLGKRRAAGRPQSSAVPVDDPALAPHFNRSCGEMQIGQDVAKDMADMRGGGRYALLPGYR